MGQFTRIAKFVSSGFPSWNRLQKDVRDLRQLYDITSHLYAAEHNRLRDALGSGVERGDSMQTSVGLITHSVQNLYDRTKKHYPERLRSLLLIALVAHLEGYFTDLVEEIAERTLEPFHTDDRREYSTRRLLSLPSLRSMQEDIIHDDCRRLTGGGLSESRKYYRRRFSIDFAALGVPYDQVVEMHDRRHLHVHRGGKCDAQFAQRHSALGFLPGEYLLVDQNYLLGSFDLTLSLGGAVGDAALSRYPRSTRKKRTWVNKGAQRDPAQVLIVRIETRVARYDPISHLPTLMTRATASRGSQPLLKYLRQVIVEGQESLVFVGGTPQELRGVMHTLKTQEPFLVRSVSQRG